MLGRGLVGLVTQTINDLYFTVSVRGIVYQPAPLVKGLLLGLGATLVAAAVPAFEATLHAAAHGAAALVLRRADPARAAAASGLGVALLAVGGGILLAAERSLWCELCRAVCLITSARGAHPAASRCC